MKFRGFTLIELMVVMAIIALLIAIAAPRYFNHIDRTKEAVLKQSLSVMRESIDKFHADTGRYPKDLDELVERHYLRKVPLDPITDSSTTWVILPPPHQEGSAYDVRSGAESKGADGTLYADW